MVSLKEKYLKDIQPKLMKENNYASVMQVPKVTRVTVNIGVGEATQTPKLLEAAVNDLTQITGRKPAITRAKKAISNFKLRKGMPIGCSVTLRRDVMYEFLDRLINVAIPRIRDFRGIRPTAFDGRGNFNLGLKEQLIFPEIDYDKVEKIRGMNITIATSARTDEEARQLLSELGMPFRK